jgi:hypothetical protein
LVTRREIHKTRNMSHGGRDVNDTTCCWIWIGCILHWCYHPSQGEVEGHSSEALCKGCFDKIAPMDGTPKTNY